MVLMLTRAAGPGHRHHPLRLPRTPATHTTRRHGNTTRARTLTSSVPRIYAHRRHDGTSDHCHVHDHNARLGALPTLLPARPHAAPRAAPCPPFVMTSCCPRKPHLAQKAHAFFTRPGRPLSHRLLWFARLAGCAEASSFRRCGSSSASSHHGPWTPSAASACAACGSTQYRDAGGVCQAGHVVPNVKVGPEPTGHRATLCPPRRRSRALASCVGGAS